jgi:hypothetical protein
MRMPSACRSNGAKNQWILAARLGFDLGSASTPLSIISDESSMYRCPGSHLPTEARDASVRPAAHRCCTPRRHISTLMDEPRPPPAAAGMDEPGPLLSNDLDEDAMEEMDEPWPPPLLLAWMGHDLSCPMTSMRMESRRSSNVLGHSTCRMDSWLVQWLPYYPPDDRPWNTDARHLLKQTAQPGHLCSCAHHILRFAR